eukprot:g2446.t1
MFDCGVHMGNDAPKDHFPDIEWWMQTKMGRDNEVSSKRSVSITDLISCVLITHFHLDHVGALPYLTERLGYKGPIYMTAPTKAVVPQLLIDYSKLRNKTTTAMENSVATYSDAEILSCMSKVRVVGLGENLRTVNGRIEVTPYYAGHVLGAVMFYVRCAGQSVLYTGDYNMTPDRHLGAAHIERPLRPDVLISESTFAMTNHPSKLRRERDFLSTVYAHVMSGGRVLIPVFSLGSVQEMSVLLEQHWERTGCDVPIYFSQGLMEKAHFYYRLFETWTNAKSESGRGQLSKFGSARSLFRFRHIRPMSNAMMRCGEAEPGETRPKIVFASPGMLIGGLSLRIFKAWAGDKNVLVVLPGYCAGGTAGYALQQVSAKRRSKNKSNAGMGRFEKPKRERDDEEGDGVWMSIPGKKQARKDSGSTGRVDGDDRLYVRCEVKNVSFASHVDSAGILRLIRLCLPKSLVLVHGEKSKMKRFQDKLAKEIPGLEVNFPSDKERLLLSCWPVHEETNDADRPPRRLSGRPNPRDGFLGLVDLLGMLEAERRSTNSTLGTLLPESGCVGCECDGIEDDDDWLSERNVKKTLERYEEEKRNAAAVEHKTGGNGVKIVLTNSDMSNKEEEDDVVVDLDGDIDGRLRRLSFAGEREAQSSSCCEDLLYNPTEILSSKHCKNRWVALAAAFLMNSVAGTGYAISLFTDLFKTTLLIDQEAVDWISTWGNVGLYSAVVGGLFYNRIGPRVTALFGAIFIGAGFLGLYGCTSRSTPEKAECSNASLGFLNFLAQHGSGWIASATVATSLRNFASEDRGVAVGLTKGSFALSSGFVAELYVGMYAPDALSFLYFMSIAAPTIILLCTPFLRLTTASTQVRTGGLVRSWMPWIALTLTTASWFVATSIGQQHNGDSKSLRFVSLFGTFFLMSLIMLLPSYTRGSNRSYASVNGAASSAGLEMVNVSTKGRSGQHYSKVREDSEAKIDDIPGVGSAIRANHSDRGIFDVVRSLEFYALAASFLVGSGAALMLVNNLTQIVQSLSGIGSVSYMDTKTTLVTLFGASNLCGRVMIGTISDRLGGENNRPGFMLVCLFMMGVSHIILAMSNVAALFPATILVGIFFGGMFSLCAAMIGDIFG